MTIFRCYVKARLSARSSAVTSRLWQTCGLCSSGPGNKTDPPADQPSKQESSSKDAVKVAKDAGRGSGGRRESLRSRQMNYSPNSISAQLMAQMQQVLDIKVEGSRAVDGDSSGLGLAGPSGKWRRIKEDLRQNPPKAPLLAPDLESAVKDVASSLGGDVQKTESDLLVKLRDHESNTREMKSISQTLFNERIDRQARQKENVRGRRSAEKGSAAAAEDGLAEQMIRVSANRMWSTPNRDSDEVASRTPRAPSRTDRPTQQRQGHVDLFGAEPLNIFKQTTATTHTPPSDVPQLITWDKLEEKVIKLSVTHPPANGFEEMILWTEQGKLWKFPIDNEQGMEAEASIGFHEHVFLEKHITDLPRRGPLRYFMELVLVGLSKNPYITVQEKIDHIDWFKQYFKKHETLLREVKAMG